MPDKVVQRSKIAEGLALVAVVVALLSSITIYSVNQKAIDRVNDSRQAITLKNCQDQNQRHLDSMAFLRRLAAQQVKVGKATQAQADEALKNYDFLFDALAPIKDCQKVVNERY